MIGPLGHDHLRQQARPGRALFDRLRRLGRRLQRGYIERGLHQRKYGIRGLRVLTVTLTDERAKNLCLLAARVVPERARKYFLFGALNQLSLGGPDPISAAVCRSARTAGSDERRPLMPVPNQLQKESVMV